MQPLLEALNWQDLHAWQIVVLFSPVLPNLWSLHHVFHHKYPGKYERLVWAYIAIFLPLVGGLIYIFFGKKRAKKLYAQRIPR